MTSTERIPEEPLIRRDYDLLVLLKRHEEGLTMRDIFTLLETSDYLTVRYRLRKLGTFGLLEWSWRDGEKRFYITHKGVRILTEPVRT